MNVDEVGEVLRGEADAATLLVVLKTTCGDGDEICRSIERIGGSPARLRGFCRVLQREVEGRPKAVGR